jgi:hypothetical protein
LLCFERLDFYRKYPVKEEIVMKRYVACLVVIIMCLVPVFTQTPSGPPVPGPEHKRFGYFVGDWIVEGEDKPSPFGPGGKITGTISFELFPGGFFLVERDETKASMGETKGLSVWGYSAEEKVYTYYSIISKGEQVYVKGGTVNGDTWTWIFEGEAEGKPFKGRVTVKEVSPTLHTFKHELSIDGKPFQVTAEGKAAKK